MKLLQLRQFVTLAETLNFHRAAEVLNMAQPPLSVSIRKLEEELGAALFLREPRGVRLTRAGEAALDNARRALFHAEQVRQAVEEIDAGKRGQVRVGFVGSVTYEVLPRLLPAFRQNYPNIELRLEESRTSELLEDIEVGAIDVAIVRTPILSPIARKVHVLQEETLVVAVARNSRFAGRASLRLKELSAEPFVIYSRTGVPSMHAITMLACQEAGFVPHVMEEAAQLQTIICLVESGLGVALVPGVVARHLKAVEFLEIEDKLQTATIGLGIISAGEEVNPAAELFRNFAIERAKLFSAPSRS
jgi:DNA-binding transcriptional LysR family regulator